MDLFNCILESLVMKLQEKTSLFVLFALNN